MRLLALQLAALAVLATAPAHAADGVAAMKASEAQWIRLAQVPGDQPSSGAITIHPSGTVRRVLPYDANIAARGMLAAGPSYCPTALAWMQWYTGHVNWPDRLGVYGTIYDWQVDWASLAESSLNDYDSADAYSATFMSLARAGAQVCPSISSWLKDNKQVVNAVGHVMTGPKVVAANGLTWAKPDYRVFFNMDNSETFAGLVDAAWVATNVWADTIEATWYSDHAATLKANYSSVLWSSLNAAYSPARTDGAAQEPWSSTSWFPDATTQVYPFLHGVIGATGGRATNLWNRLNASFPAWTACKMPGSTGREEPFSEIGHAASVRNDKARANAYLEACKVRWSDRGRPWPYNVRHAGVVAMTAAKLSR